MQRPPAGIVPESPQPRAHGLRARWVRAQTPSASPPAAPGGPPTQPRQPVVVSLTASSATPRARSPSLRRPSSDGDADDDDDDDSSVLAPAFPRRDGGGVSATASARRRRPLATELPAPPAPPRPGDGGVVGMWSVDGVALWTTRQVALWERRRDRASVNEFRHVFPACGRPLATGGFSDQERRVLVDRVMDFRARGWPLAGNWGFVACALPSRTGLQVQDCYRRLVASREIADSDYGFDDHAVFSGVPSSGATGADPDVVEAMIDAVYDDHVATLGGETEAFVERALLQSEHQSATRSSLEASKRAAASTQGPAPVRRRTASPVLHLLESDDDDDDIHNNNNSSNNHANSVDIVTLPGSDGHGLPATLADDNDPMQVDLPDPRGYKRRQRVLGSPTRARPRPRDDDAGTTQRPRIADTPDADSATVHRQERGPVDLDGSSVRLVPSHTPATPPRKAAEPQLAADDHFVPTAVPDVPFPRSITVSLPPAPVVAPSPLGPSPDTLPAVQAESLPAFFAILRDTLASLHSVEKTSPPGCAVSLQTVQTLGRECRSLYHALGDFVHNILPTLPVVEATQFRVSLAREIEQMELHLHPLRPTTRYESDSIMLESFELQVVLRWCLVDWLAFFQTLDQSRHVAATDVEPLLRGFSLSIYSPIVVKELVDLFATHPDLFGGASVVVALVQRLASALPSFWAVFNGVAKGLDVLPGPHTGSATRDDLCEFLWDLLFHLTAAFRAPNWELVDLLLSRSPMAKDYVVSRSRFAAGGGGARGPGSRSTGAAAAGGGGSSGWSQFFHGSGEDQIEAYVKRLLSRCLLLSQVWPPSQDFLVAHPWAFFRRRNFGDPALTRFPVFLNPYDRTRMPEEHEPGDPLSHVFLKLLHLHLRKLFPAVYGAGGVSAGDEAAQRSGVKKFCSRFLYGFPSQAVVDFVRGPFKDLTGIRMLACTAIVLAAGFPPAERKPIRNRIVQLVNLRDSSPTASTVVIEALFLLATLLQRNGEDLREVIASIASIAEVLRGLYLERVHKTPAQLQKDKPDDAQQLELLQMALSTILRSSRRLFERLDARPHLSEYALVSTVATPILDASKAFPVALRSEALKVVSAALVARTRVPAAARRVPQPVAQPQPPAAGDPAADEDLDLVLMDLDIDVLVQNQQLEKRGRVESEQDAKLTDVLSRFVLPQLTGLVSVRCKQQVTHTPGSIDGKLFVSTLDTMGALAPILVDASLRSWPFFLGAYGPDSFWLRAARSDHRQIPLRVFTAVLSSRLEVVDRFLGDRKHQDAMIHLWLLSLAEREVTIQHTFTAALLQRPSVAIRLAGIRAEQVETADRFTEERLNLLAAFCDALGNDGERFEHARSSLAGMTVVMSSVSKELSGQPAALRAAYIRTCCEIVQTVLGARPVLAYDPVRPAGSLLEYLIHSVRRDGPALGDVSVLLHGIAPLDYHTDPVLQGLLFDIFAIGFEGGTEARFLAAVKDLCHRFRNPHSADLRRLRIFVLDHVLTRYLRCGVAELSGAGFTAALCRLVQTLACGSTADRSPPVVHALESLAAPLAEVVVNKSCFSPSFVVKQEAYRCLASMFTVAEQVSARPEALWRQRMAPRLEDLASLLVAEITRDLYTLLCSRNAAAAAELGDLVPSGGVTRVLLGRLKDGAAPDLYGERRVTPLIIRGPIPDNRALVGLVQSAFALLRALVLSGGPARVAVLDAMALIHRMVTFGPVNTGTAARGMERAYQEFVLRLGTDGEMYRRPLPQSSGFLGGLLL